MTKHEERIHLPAVIMSIVVIAVISLVNQCRGADDDAPQSDPSPLKIPTENRTWLSTDGRELVGKITELNLANNTITFVRASDGEVFRGYPIDKLDDDDIRLIAPSKAPPETTWKIIEVRDEFGKITGKKRLLCKTQGRFSDTATTDGELLVFVYRDGNDLSFRLGEHGRKPTMSALDCSYDVTIRLTSGTKIIGMASICSGSLDVCLSPSTAQKLDSAISSRNGKEDFSIILSLKDFPIRYVFDVPSITQPNHLELVKTRAVQNKVMSQKAVSEERKQIINELADVWNAKGGHRGRFDELDAVKKHLSADEYQYFLSLLDEIPCNLCRGNGCIGCGQTGIKPSVLRSRRR